MTKRSLVYPLLFVLLALNLSACGLFSSGAQRQEKSADELFNEGRTAFEKEKYRASIDAFQQLRNWYPFSPHVTAATIAIADAHYALEEYPEAVAVYTEFERLHPTNPEAPKAAFQLAMCHYQQIKTTDRDQIPTKQAIAAFSRVTDTYPLSPYSDEAKAKVVECREKLAQSELSIANYYYRTKSYAAAQKRLEYLVKEYADTSRAATAQTLLTQVNAVLAGEEPSRLEIPQDEEEKQPFWKRIF